MSYRKRPDPGYAKKRSMSARKTMKAKPRAKHESDVKSNTSVSYSGELLSPSTRKTAVNLVQEFRKLGIKYVLAGAFPVQFYGRERFSRDIDVVLHLGEAEAENLFKLLKDGRYTILYPLEHEQKIDSPSDLLKIGLLKVKDKETGSLADIILRSDDAGFKFDIESEKRLRKVNLNGEQVQIPSPEDYIVMKLKSRRPGTHDFEDIISTFIKQFNSVDWSYLTRRAKEENLTTLLNHYREAVERMNKGDEPP